MKVLISPTGYFVAYIADNVTPAEDHFALPLLVAAPTTAPLHDACQLVDGQWLTPTPTPVPLPSGSNSIGS